MHLDVLYAQPYAHYFFSIPTTFWVSSDQGNNQVCLPGRLKRLPADLNRWDS
jgi:hypothetical protein